jgi:hypothetical protein
MLQMRQRDVRPHLVRIRSPFETVEEREWDW